MSAAFEFAFSLIVIVIMVKIGVFLYGLPIWLLSIFVIVAAIFAAILEK